MLQKSESDTFYITNERVGENRGGRIRTVDHLNPIQVRYQAALHPETNYAITFFTRAASKRRRSYGIAILFIIIRPFVVLYDKLNPWQL